RRVVSKTPPIRRTRISDDTSASAVTSEHPPGRDRLKRLIQGLVSIAVVAGIFLGVMPRIANYGDVWETIRAMSSLEMTTLVVIGLWNLVTYWLVLTAVLPGLTYPQAAVSNQASTAISNTLPAGGALGVGVTYAMYSSWGFTGADVTRSVVVSGIWNNFVKLGLPIVALALLAATEDVSFALLIGSLIGVAVLVGAIVAFGLILKSNWLAKRLGDGTGRIVSWFKVLFHKPPVASWGEAAVRFRTNTADLLADRWIRLTVSSLISHLSLYIVLLVALRHVGVSEADVSWTRVLAAFAFVRLISALPITPGGLGVVELGYTAALGIGMDDITQAQIVAAVLVFRFITYFLPIPLGAASYVFWRRNRSWRAGPPPKETEPAGPTWDGPRE
ncbi:MAG: lysylphosphatidylglycerol synthase domain-containing protein, partial [Acidimicrobiia bacterium]|nr:lysylphosphatidylglycerol synthase domain-containing protein [Acidimicrobiia bacterium]